MASKPIDIMEYIDITLPISEDTPAYPGDPEVRFESSKENGYRITSVCMSSHSGTHVDAPVHYIDGGCGVDSIPLEDLNGDAEVIDLTGVSGTIGRDDLVGITGDPGIIILKTGFSCRPCNLSDYNPINIDCAEYLTRLGIRCVVTDAPSIEKYGGGGEVHRILLGNGISIIEMADLSKVPTGRYILNALPLKLTGCDGSPIRAILRIPGDGENSE